MGFDQLGGLAHLVDLWVARAAKVGKTQHSHPRLHVELPGHLRGIDGDGGQRFGVGVDIHGCIAEKIDAIAHDHQIDAAEHAPLRRCAHDLQGRTQDIRVVVGQPGDISAGMAVLHHGRAEIVGLAHQFAGSGQCHPFALTLLVKGGGVLVTDRIPGGG